MKKNKSLVLIVLAVLVFLSIACESSVTVAEAFDSAQPIEKPTFESYPTSIPPQLDINHLNAGDFVGFTNGMGDSFVMISEIGGIYSISLMWEGTFGGYLYKSATPPYQMAKTINLVPETFSVLPDNTGIYIDTSFAEKTKQYEAKTRVGTVQEGIKTSRFAVWMSYDNVTWRCVSPN